MNDIPYTKVPGKIGRLLAKVKEVNVPEKVTNSWLKTVGFTSSNDHSLIGVLRVVGLIEPDGKPTNYWQDFRGPRGKQVLADGIRKGYSTLYSVYPDAHNKSDSDLESIISQSTKSGHQVISLIASTFKKLVAEADFSNSVEDDLSGEAISPHNSADKSPVVKGENTQPSLHIDLQIHISADSTTEQIDAIFSSMAKHLYGAK